MFGSIGSIGILDLIIEIWFFRILYNVGTMMEKYFAILDVTDKEIVGISARWLRKGGYAFERFARVPSKGFKKGMVADLNFASDSLIKVMHKLMEKTTRGIHDIYVGVSSPSMKIIPSSGVVLLSRYGRTITDNDVKRCLNIAQAVKMPLDKEFLHRTISGISVDNERDIANPVGLEGVKLEGKSNILVIDASMLRNMSKCISQAGFVPAGFIYNGLASSYRVLTEDDKESCVAILDINKGLEELTIFNQNVLTASFVTKIPPKETLYQVGQICEEAVTKTAAAISARPEWAKVKKVYLMGEGALVDGMVETLEREFTIPVVVPTCRVKPSENLPPDRTGYITCLGMLDYLQEERHRFQTGGNILKRASRRILTFLNKYF